MAIEGSGTQQDPWLVTTYAELVEKAAESGGYIKVANDINITDEYPNGNMPELVLNGSTVDGDGKIIANWYNNNASHSSISGNGIIKNAKIRNIYHVNGSVALSFCKVDHYNGYLFENCEISGIIAGNCCFANLNYVHKLMKECSVNLLLKSGAGLYFVWQAYMKDPKIDSCYIKIKSSGGNASIFNSEYGINNAGEDSYYDIEASSLNSITATFSNCVFDIKTNATFTLNTSSTAASVSIVNSTNAPNVTAQNQIKAVTDEYWLDTSYLSSIGFNIG